MPMYEYKCTKCNYVSEMYAPAGSIPQEIICEDCGGPSYKIMSVPGISSGNSWAGVPDPSEVKMNVKFSTDKEWKQI